MKATEMLVRIKEFRQALTSAGQNAPGIRLEDSGNDELDELAREINNMLDKLEHSEARDLAILEHMEDGYFELDKDARITCANRAFCRMLGYGRSQLLGITFASLQGFNLDIDGPPAIIDTVSGVPASTWLMRSNGSKGYYESHLSWIADAEGNVQGYRGILHDVSEHVQHQRALYEMVYTDALTSLGNRKAFYHDLDLHMGRDRATLALMFIDLDRFKQVNDTFGHDVGDELLACLAERLRSTVRSPGNAYRLGGDEFTLVLPATDVVTATALGERILKVLSQPVSVAGNVIDFVTPSIGLAVAPVHASKAADLLKCADQAMYEAKRKRGQLCLYSS